MFGDGFSTYAKNANLSRGEEEQWPDNYIK